MAATAIAARAGWVLAALLALTACGGDDASPPTTTGPTGPSGPSVLPSVPESSAPSSPTTSATVPGTAALPVDPGELGVLDAALDTDGTIGGDAALALVAAGYGSIPGVAPAPRALVDGGPVLRAVLADRSGLGAEQQDAVAGIAGRPGTPLQDALASTSPRVAVAAEIVTRSLATFARSAGDVPISLLELPVDNGDGTRNFSSPDAHATALVVGAGEDIDCRIRLNAASPLDPTLGTSDPAFVAAVARETFHCLQYGAHGSIRDVPMWVVEGAAAYAAERVAGASATTVASWQRWVGEPQRPLQRRTSDAIGFFFLVGEQADPFAFADAMLGDPSAESIRRRLEASDLFDRWGRYYAMHPEWDGGFAYTAPGASGLTAPMTQLAVAVDGRAVVVGGRGDLSASPHAVTAAGDVLVVTAGPGDRGAIRFANGQHVALAQATQAVCLAPGGCGCPGVAVDALTIGEAGGPDLFVGVGPSSGGGVTLAARSLARWCQEVAAPPPADVVDPCLVGSWRTQRYVAPDTPGVAREITGGEGGSVVFDADRTVTVDLTPMAPVVITTTGPAGRSTTTLTYRGTGQGTWRADAGVVEVAGVDPASFGIGVSVTAADGSLLGVADLPIGDVRAAFYASVLGTARYACTPVSLALTHVLPGLGATGGFELVPA